MNIRHPIGSFVPVVILPGTLNKKRLRQYVVGEDGIKSLQDGKIRCARVDSDMQLTVTATINDLGPRYVLHPDCVNFLYDDPAYDWIPNDSPTSNK